jgi:hypothetical protein
MGKQWAKGFMMAGLVLAISLPLSQNAEAAKSPKLAKCDGKHRRTANPYGSILPSVDPATGATTPANPPAAAGNIDLFPQQGASLAKPAGRKAKPAAQVPPISAASSLILYRSC